MKFPEFSADDFGLFENKLLDGLAVLTILRGQSDYAILKRTFEDERILVESYFESLRSGKPYHFKVFIKQKPTQNGTPLEKSFGLSSSNIVSNMTLVFDCGIGADGLEIRHHRQGRWEQYVLNKKVEILMEQEAFWNLSGTPIDDSALFPEITE